MSCVTCHLSTFICHPSLSPVICHLSPTPTACATDPPPANSVTLHIKLVHQDKTQNIKLFSKPKEWSPWWLTQFLI